MTPAARDHVAGLAPDDTSGTWGMCLFIVTEAMLFLVLFFGYFYLGARAPVWPPANPDAGPALGMLVLFLLGTAALYRAAATLREGQPRGAAVGVLAGLALGSVFLILEVLELRKHVGVASPGEDAYSSIVVGISGLHALHVLAGLLMAAWVALLLPRAGAAGRPVQRPLLNVILYWDFLAALWVAALVILYLLPHLPGSGP
jgi:heme/copper-type cytochrome/quinol oxidase subunit 3